MQVGDNVQFLFEGSWYSGVYVGDVDEYFVVVYTKPLHSGGDFQIKHWVLDHPEKEKIHSMCLKFASENDYGIGVKSNEIKPDKNQIILNRVG